MIAPLWSGFSEEPKLVAARQILASIEPGRPVVCMDELAEAIAFQGRRAGVAEMPEMPRLVSEAASNGAGGYIAIPAYNDERLRRRARGQLTLTEVSRVDVPVHQRTRSWRLYRVTAVSD